VARRGFARTDRLSKQIVQVVAVALQRETREELLYDVVVTGCDVTRDLSYATVHYYLPEHADRDAVSKALGRAAGFLRSRVGQQIRARNTPELRFSYDQSVAHGRRIEEILADIGPLPDDGDEDEAASDDAATDAD